MPDKPTIREQYEEYRKVACNLCGGGVERIHPFLSEPRHTVRNETVSCTAMPFEAWAGWRIERLTEALREIDELGGCDCIGEMCGVCVARKALAAQPESGVTKYSWE